MQGVFLFGANYILVYHATLAQRTGCRGVSAIVLMNIATAPLFLKRKVEPLRCGGGDHRFAGVALMFAPEFEVLEKAHDTSSSTDQKRDPGLGFGRRWVPTPPPKYDNEKTSKGLPRAKPMPTECHRCPVVADPDPGRE